MSMSELMEFFHIENLISQPYNIGPGNCQSFSTIVYDRIKEELKFTEMNFLLYVFG
jgi:hypothetical protein